MTIKEYKDLLDHHDWYYEYSDDHSVWKAGCANESRLIQIAEGKPKWMELFVHYARMKRGAHV